ncbi:unnamed protein product [Blepharisma stoltei]|uniref:Uncharacterized protein n=1 Tax=Blepharisma stoltei TaxID=1481888 RepID=A0AAU9J5G4_9CILI|nr:unnamed protein product [Blepharisma stoltei]
MKILLLLGVCWATYLRNEEKIIPEPMPIQAENDEFPGFGNVQYINQLKSKLIEEPAGSSRIDIKIDGRNYISPWVLDRKSKGMAKMNKFKKIEKCLDCEESIKKNTEDYNELNFDEEMEKINKQIEELGLGENQIDKMEENIDLDIMYTIEKQLKEIKKLQMGID